MKHSDIIKEIYEKNKDKLKSEKQISLVLTKAFMVFRYLMKKGCEFRFPGLFKVKHSYRSKRIIEQVNEGNRLRYNAEVSMRMKKYRSWTKKIMDEDFV